jgi:hypothetical protein
LLLLSRVEKDSLLVDELRFLWLLLLSRVENNILLTNILWFLWLLWDVYLAAG